ncbi:MAG: phosphotransferase family protein [Alphaproteobacteria bacterium]|jgi:aminoglycoside phosphotransferase (APT) family kinase protein|nr:phosphotransferase family protein [Alphaproteobacteria bacterium]MBU0863370.1 phosphotransferase family protein [Alphaproteobacteria bacterium]MBU1826595.1 phosphotransferase family protein [Alphaproteobacteria bacterium]
MVQQGERSADSAPRELDVRLTELLETCIEGLRGPLTIGALTGGRSNPTFLLHAHEQCFVLRSRPAAASSPSAHRIDREVRVLQALEGSDVPVPRVLLHVADASYFGAPFYLMTLVDGEAIEDPALPDLADSLRTRAYHRAIDILASLHNLSPDAIGLAGFGGQGDYNARQLTRWSGQMASDGSVPPALLELGSVLTRTLPRQTRTSVVHGDYRFGNLLQSEGAISAVLDWELSTLGDPFADLAYFLLPFDLPRGGLLLRGLSEKHRRDSGIPDRETLASRYCRATGQPLPSGWPAYRAFALFRTAAIAHGVFHRQTAGALTAHQACQLDELAEIGLAILGRNAPLP